MRTTVRLDDELIEELKTRARKQNVSLTQLLNRIVRAGLKAATARKGARLVYREDAHAMGAPRVALDKALALAAALEDEEIGRELTVRR